MATVQGQDIDSFADHMWRDYEIQDFDWPSECVKCIEQIKSNQPEDWQTGILVTHTVPHPSLNGHMAKVTSKFNVYSGVSWLLDEIRADYAICGHTQTRSVGRTINGIKCVNVGNNYFPPFQHCLIDV